MMPDDKRKKKLDAKRIDVHDRNELRWWMNSLGVSKPRLLAAVAAKGTGARAVREYLKTDRWANGEVLDMNLRELV